jgi:PAS domain S-box-containing protein
MPVPAAILRLHDRVFVEANDLFLRMTGLDRPQPNAVIAADSFWAKCADETLARLENTRELTVVQTGFSAGPGNDQTVGISAAPVVIDGQRAVLLTLAGDQPVAALQTPASDHGDIAALCHLAPTALHALDRDMRVLGVSQAWLDWLGYPRDAVIGTSISAFMTASSASHFQSHTWDMLAQAGTVREVEISFVTRAGDTVDAVVSTRATLDENGVPKLVMAAPVDITARKQSQAAFDALFTLSPIPMLVRKLDDSRILDINDAFAAATGYFPETIVGHVVDELGLFDSRIQRQVFETTIRAADRVQNQDAKLKTADGQSLECLLSAQKIHAFGQTCVLIILQDVSDRRRSEMELYEAIEKVMGDTSWFSRSVIEKLATLRSPPRSGARAAEIGDLTPREREVLGLISHGMADADIAAKLGLTRSTVRNHVATLYSKIGVHSRSSAIIWARERGINFAWTPAATANLIRGPIAQSKTAGTALSAKSRGPR